MYSPLTPQIKRHTGTFPTLEPHGHSLAPDQETLYPLPGTSPISKPDCSLSLSLSALHAMWPLAASHP